MVIVVTILSFLLWLLGVYVQLLFWLILLAFFYRWIEINNTQVADGNAKCFYKVVTFRSFLAFLREYVNTLYSQLLLFLGHFFFHDEYSRDLDHNPILMLHGYF